jgi:hypothetical protein
MNRTEKIASHWTTPETNVFVHLPFFIFMMVSASLSLSSECLQDIIEKRRKRRRMIRSQE